MTNQLKSKKLQALETMYVPLIWRGNGRWVRAYKHIETDNYFIEAGYQGQPCDYELEMVDFEELRDEMRETAGLRSWQIASWND